jgi:hypothetical protein
LRDLTIPEIQARFDNHQKLHEFEVDILFDVKNLSKEQYRWLCKGYRHFTIFDIEAQLFDARMGYVICWYALRWDILTGEKEMVYDHLSPDDMKKGYKTKNFDFDIRILQTLSDELSQADVVIGHYISKFDLPYVTARCHLTKQDNLVPKYNDFRIIDTWRVTKNKYNMYNSGGNSLRNAGRVIAGYDDKTSVDLFIWKNIYYKDHPKWKKSMKYICDHCEIDVYQNFDVFEKEMKRIPVGGASI